MELIIAAFLLSKEVLPSIDRDSLNLQARAEALQPRARAPLTVRAASSAGTLDFASITTICRAAGSQADPAAFVARLSRAYSLSAEESLSLRSSCAAYLTGRAEAQRH